MSMTFAWMAFEEYGLKCVIHPHVGGYLETPAEIDAVLERTNPELVGLCFDMAHVAYGGGNPVTVLDKWRQRTWYLHVKGVVTSASSIDVLARDGDYFDGVESGRLPRIGSRHRLTGLAIRKILDEAELRRVGDRRTGHTAGNRRRSPGKCPSQPRLSTGNAGLVEGSYTTNGERL